MRVIAIINQKGGVGKTTAAANLGHALAHAHAGLKIMLADLDPQGQLAACLGIHGTGAQGMDRVMLHGESLSTHTVAARDNLSLVPAGTDLAEYELRNGGMNGVHTLSGLVKGLTDRPDILLLDCAPSSGMLVANAIIAADDVLMPVAGDYLSLTGLARLMLTLKRLEPMRDEALRRWIFFSRFTPRRRLSQEVFGKVVQHFPHNLLCTSIQEAAALAECAGAGKTIFEYRGGSRAAREFRALADDLLHARVVGNEQETTSDVA